MFAGFFLDPAYEEPAPQIDDNGVVIAPCDRSKSSPKVAATAAVEWIGSHPGRAAHVCLIIIRALQARRELPLLHISQAIEDILPHVRTLVDTKQDWPEFRSRVLPAFLTHLDSLLAEVAALDELVAATARGEICVTAAPLHSLFWSALMLAAHVLEPDAAYVTFVTSANVPDPLRYTYIGGLILGRFVEKRAHYAAALATSMGTAIKETKEPAMAVSAVLDFFAGLGLKKWENCKDDTHNIYPITLMTLCCSAIVRTSRPREPNADRALDILLEYSHRFAGEACLWEWCAKMALASPCDRGIGDMDVTPFMQAIVIYTAFERRLRCTPECFVVAAKRRAEIAKLRDSPIRAQGDIDPHHELFMGGLCNIMSSVLNPSVQFTQLLRVSYVMGKQATADDTIPYLGEHWNATVACLQVFARATQLYLPAMQPCDWVNVNKLTIPLAETVAAVIYGLADYTQDGRCDTLRREVLQGLVAVSGKFDAKNCAELYKGVFAELLRSYKVGPVSIAATTFTVDSFRRLWTSKHHSEIPHQWWPVLRPLIRLVEQDDMKLFWSPVVQAVALFVQSVALQQTTAGRPNSAFIEAKRSLLDLQEWYRCAAAANKSDEVETLRTTIWQISEIDRLAS